jgi:hypothetical protein
MDAVLVVALVTVGIILVAMLVYVLLRWRAGQDQTWRGIAQGPQYRHEQAHQEYFRRSEDPQTDSQHSQPQKRPSNDPRFESLPRCSKCGSAIGYNDEKCPKCAAPLRVL